MKFIFWRVYLAELLRKWIFTKLGWINFIDANFFRAAGRCVSLRHEHLACPSRSGRFFKEHARKYCIFHKNYFRDFEKFNIFSQKWAKNRIGSGKHHSTDSALDLSFCDSSFCETSSDDSFETKSISSLNSSKSTSPVKTRFRKFIRYIFARKIVFVFVKTTF